MEEQLRIAMRARSGEVNDTSKLVSVFYSLLRDHVPPGVLEKLVLHAEEFNGETQYTNGWLAQYAQDLAQRLTNDK